MIFKIALVVVFVVGIVMYNLFPVIQVVGDSMYPTYQHDELIFGTKIYLKSRLKKGDVILYKSPTEKDRIVIKRIDKIEKRNGVLFFYCLGDNAKVSQDSRYYGFISSKSLVCKVLNQRRKI